MRSIEDIENKLKEELGEKTYQKAYPLLIDFGEDILFEENLPRL
jgi:hypothetical protein